MLTDGGKKQIFITDDTLASTQFIAENAVFTLVKLFGPLTIHLHSIFFYKNNFYKKQGWIFSNLLYWIKKHNTKRLSLSWFGLFL